MFKAKPLHVYREEFRMPLRPTRNATRQTFDREKYGSWRRYRESFPEEGSTVRFFEGEITWRET